MKRDKEKKKIADRACYLRNRTEILARYHDEKNGINKIKKGIEVYKSVMRDFYTKSHRLECYGQLLKDMKEQWMRKAA